MPTFLLTMMTIQTTTTTMRLKTQKLSSTVAMVKVLFVGWLLRRKEEHLAALRAAAHRRKEASFRSFGGDEQHQRFAMMTMMSSSSRGQKTTTAAVGKGVKPVPVPDNEELPFSRSAHHPWGENDERSSGTTRTREEEDPTQIRSTGAVVPGTHRSSGTVTPRSVEKRRLRGGSSGFEDTVGDEPPGRGRLGREQPG